MPVGNKKVTHTLTNLQLSAAGLFEYAWPFCYHQALKGLNGFYISKKEIGCHSFSTYAKCSKKSTFLTSRGKIVNTKY